MPGAATRTGRAQQILAQRTLRLEAISPYLRGSTTSEMPAFWSGQYLACMPFPLLESSGMVATEAQATGLPVVAVAAGVLTEVVRDGEIGRLLKPSNEAQVSAAAIDYVANSPWARFAAGRCDCRR